MGPPIVSRFPYTSSLGFQRRFSYYVVIVVSYCTDSITREGYAGVLGDTSVAGLIVDASAAETIVAEGGSDPGVVCGIPAAVSSRPIFFLGLFKSASVIPLASFVRPITGGSPFFTNSYSP